MWRTLWPAGPIYLLVLLALVVPVLAVGLPFALGYALASLGSLAFLLRSRRQLGRWSDLLARPLTPIYLAGAVYFLALCWLDLLLLEGGGVPGEIRRPVALALAVPAGIWSIEMSRRQHREPRH